MNTKSIFKVAAVALLVSQLVACDNNDEKQASNNTAQVSTTENSVHVDNVQQEAVTQLTKYNIYNKEDQAGSLSVQQSGNVYSSDMELGWNNRQIKIEEVITVDEQGYITSQTVKGISAFGAPIDESFSQKGSIAQWQSTNEQGEEKVEGKKFYVAMDGTGVANSALLKAISNSETGKVDLLPSGQAGMIKLDSVTLDNGKEKKTVHLIGITGFGFSPDFAWYDDDYNFFATDGGGWFGVIPEGWGREHLEQLQEIQKKADNQYLKDLADKLIHTSEKPILVTNANYVDVITGKLVEGQSILVQDGRITKIGSEIPEGDYTEVDASGKTLIPGLWDMHGHLSKSDGLLNMPAGVTNVRDMGNTHDNIVDIERMSENNEIMGSDVYRSGFMDRESPYAMKMGKTVNSLEDAMAAVDWYAENGYPQIKTYSSMEPAWIEPLARHIHDKGLRLSGHIPAFMTAEEAINAGFDEIQHINMIFLNFLGKNIDTRQRLRFTIPGEKAHELDLNSKEVNDFMALLKGKGTVIDPTVSVFRSLLLGEAGKVDPENAAIYEHLPVTIARNFKKAWMDIKPEERDAYNKSADAMVGMVKKLHDSGVTVVPGTDSIAGFTLHRELILYSQGGISNADVLKLATITSAEVVGNEENVGSIEEGKQADLVFIDGNPLEDMNDIRKVALVIKGQNLYKPDEIYEEIGVKPFTKSVDFEL